MRINLAKIVPVLFWVFVIVVMLWAQNGGGSSTDRSSHRGYSTYTDTTDADRYLDSLAVELARPGVYVDPEVPADALTSARADEFGRIASSVPGPVRIAVVPIDRVRAASTSEFPVGSPQPAYEPDELVHQLYDRVGVDGTYALLVHAGSSREGRSFTAYQIAEDRPFYDIEGALDAAIDCCAPDYDRMLERFLAEAGNEKPNWLLIWGGILGGGAALIGGSIGVSHWRRHRKERAEDRAVAEALRPLLNEEVIELSDRVGALPTLPDAAGPDARATLRRILDLIEECRHRLDEPTRMDTPEEAEEVVTRLADARYLLVTLDAQCEGRPVPERRAPCFFDPRHGPSTSDRGFQPQGGSARDVPVCDACALRLDADETPEVRQINVGGVWKPYWQADRYSRPYVNGNWQRRKFPDARTQRIRHAPARTLSRNERREPRVTFVWESDRTGGSSNRWSSSGGRSSGSSRRSFGGGSSSRSSTRSGGSRRF